ncbi:MAG TPA: prolyl oligopeptidase family serine peptidase [Stellaceae bacterium]|nr:prolyl oligopeptidase family serine peptidase [Stellaceae bacterium]
MWSTERAEGATEGFKDRPCAIVVAARRDRTGDIRNARTPTFAYVGALDIECPAPQTQEFWHALHELGVPTSYAIYPGEGHRFRAPADLADAERRTVEWFDRYLKP